MYCTADMMIIIFQQNFNSVENPVCKMAAYMCIFASLKTGPRSVLSSSSLICFVCIVSWESCSEQSFFYSSSVEPDRKEMQLTIPSPTQPSLGLTENGLKKRNYQVGENVLLKPEVMGKWPDWFKLIDRQLNSSNNHLLQLRCVEEHLWLHYMSNLADGL